MALRLRKLANSLLLARPSPTTITSTTRPLVFPGIAAAARKMSTETAPRKYEWLVVIPDFPGVLEKRREIRPLHFAGLKSAMEAKLYEMGGAILNSVPKDDDPASLDMVGSTVVIVAESREEIIATLKKDVYATSGVWNVDDAQMWPLKCAFRFPVKQ